MQLEEKFAVDALSIGIMGATLAEALPSVAAIFTIVWTGIRIKETETVKALISRWRKPGGEL